MQGGDQNPPWTPSLGAKAFCPLLLSYAHPRGSFAQAQTPTKRARSPAASEEPNVPCGHRDLSLQHLKPTRGGCEGLEGRGRTSLACCPCAAAMSCWEMTHFLLNQRRSTGLTRRLADFCHSSVCWELSGQGWLSPQVRGSSSSISPERQGPGACPAPRLGAWEAAGLWAEREGKAKECSCPKAKQKPPKATGQRCRSSSPSWHRGWERCRAARFWEGRAAADGVMGTKVRVTAACPTEETCLLSAREQFKAPGSLPRARAEEIVLMQKHQQSLSTLGVHHGCYFGDSPSENPLTKHPAPPRPLLGMAAEPGCERQWEHPPTPAGKGASPVPPHLPGSLI